MELGRTTTFVQVPKRFDSGHDLRCARDYIWVMRPLHFLLVLAAFAWQAQAGVVTQTSRVHGVTVAATAGNLDAAAPVWDFAVVLDSGRELPDDVAANAVLVDASGNASKALVWEGAPRTGRHRAGVLKFIALDPHSAWVELRITRPGEARPRTFGWLRPGQLVAAR